MSTEQEVSSLELSRIFEERILDRVTDPIAEARIETTGDITAITLKPEDGETQPVEVQNGRHGRLLIYQTKTGYFVLRLPPGEVPYNAIDGSLSGLNINGQGEMEFVQLSGETNGRAYAEPSYIVTDLHPVDSTDPQDQKFVNKVMGMMVNGEATHGDKVIKPSSPSITKLGWNAIKAGVGAAWTTMRSTKNPHLAMEAAKYAARDDAEGFVASGLKERFGRILRTLRKDWSPIVNDMHEKIDPEKRSAWATIKSTVLGESKGFSRIFRFFGAVTLWMGISVSNIFLAHILKAHNIIEINDEESVLEAARAITRLTVAPLKRIFRPDPDQDRLSWIGTIGETLVDRFESSTT